jgi:putative phosphoesterase
MHKKIDLNHLNDRTDITIGVLSDTHNQLNEIVIDAFNNCDAILHAGDIGDANVLAQLSLYSDHILSVRGNNDTEEKWPSSDLHVLAEIPEYLELCIQNQVIGLIHGHQYEPVRKRHDKLRQHFPHADIVIYGHSHRLVCDKQQQPWVINPGAGGYTRTFGGASCMIMQYKNSQWSINNISHQE